MDNNINLVPEKPEGNVTYIQLPPPPKSRAWLVCLISILTFLFLCFFTIICCLGLVNNLMKDAMSSCGTSSGSDSIEEKVIVAGGDKTIAVIDVKGIIANGHGSEICDARKLCGLIRLLQDEALKGKGYAGIILDMDTPGGEVIASDEVHSALLKLKKTANIPIVTCMHSLGASGGYYIASASDYIIANRMTFTGSIGVIMSSVNVTDLIGKIGVKPMVYRSGKMKDIMSPMRPPSEEEQAYMNAMIQQSFREFAQVVADGRKAYKTAEDVMAADFGDGRVLSGTDALKYGLVDELGGFEQAIAYMEKTLKNNNLSVVHLKLDVSLMELLESFKTDIKQSMSLLPEHGYDMKHGNMYYLLP